MPVFSMMECIYDDAAPNTRFRDRMTGDELFVNYGISLDGTRPADVSRANMNMVDWMIKELDITAQSYVLEVGCGKGGYILNVAAKTGCKFLGVDILPTYVKVGKEAVIARGLQTQGDIIEGSYQEFVYQMKEQGYEGIAFTHILCVGSLYYVHADLDHVLKNFINVSNPTTKIFINDYNRLKPWTECKKYQTHLKVENALLSVEEMEAVFARVGLKAEQWENINKLVMPALAILRDAALEEDPTSENITYPIMFKAIEEKEVFFTSIILTLAK